MADSVTQLLMLLCLAGQAAFMIKGFTYDKCWRDWRVSFMQYYFAEGKKGAMDKVRLRDAVL